MKRIIWIVIILALISIPTLAQDDSAIIGEAMVSSVVVDETAEGIVLTISGDLPDSCTEVGDIGQSMDDDTITILVETTRPADSICAAVMSSFEATYMLDSSELEAGDYTVDVNGITETVTIVTSADAETVELTCPIADDDFTLFDDLGMCFVYPSENDVISGNDFVLISQPLTSNALLLIQIEDADETTLEDIQEQLIAADLIVYDDIVIGNQDALVLEVGTIREAHIIVNETIYTFIVEPFSDETGGILWAEVIGSVFFPEPE